jgi:DNA repair protein RadD
VTILRDYQTQAIEEIRACIRRGKRSIVLVSPTGSGKTSISAAMIRSAARKNNSCLFLAHRKELIEQCSTRLDDIGLDHGVIMSQHPRRKPWLNVHVCSVPTLIRRKPLPRAQLIFIDEAHRAMAKSYRDIMSQYPQAVFVLLTATPIRADGEGLGDIADDMVLCPSVAELTEMGYLVPARVYAPSKPDLGGVHIQNGDYRPDELATAVDKPKLTGSIVEHWLRLGQNRQTVVFAVNIEHSKHIVAEFQQAGISCEHLDGNTPGPERTAILRRLADGTTRVLSNCAVLTEGWDSPVVSCVVLARPTVSTGLYLQMAGRGLRPHPGKTDVIILDHAGATHQHGFVDDEREWSLDSQPRKRGRDDNAPSFSVRMCAECWAAFKAPAMACPYCGAAYQGRDMKPPDVADGELVELVQPAEPKLYKVGKLSSNPVFAYFQREAERKSMAANKGARYAHVMARMFEQGQVSVPAEVMEQWKRCAGRRGAA